MTGTTDRHFLPWWIRNIPADLAAVIILVVTANILVLAPVLRDTPFRIVFGLPLVLFLPGYAMVSALFPERGQEVTAEGNEETNGELVTNDRMFRGIDGIERVALSFGLSIASVPLIGLVLNFTPWGIRLIPILVSVSGFTLVATVIGIRRRWDLPEDDRFTVPYRDWYRVARLELLHPESRTDFLLNVFLVVTILIAISSVTYAVAVPREGESFTEFYILTEQPNGELVADNYPTEFVVGEPQSLIIGIGNQEHETIEYIVLVKLQRVGIVGNSSEVIEESELDLFHVSVRHNETWQEDYSVRSNITGKNLRLVFLLYKSEVPATQTLNNAYREVHLWVNITQT